MNIEFLNELQIQTNSLFVPTYEGNINCTIR